MPYTSKIRATSKYLILFLVILNVACKKETTEPFFRMDESELLQNMSAEEGNRKVTISTNQKYTVISSQSWCKVSVFQDYFSISVYGNEDLQSRTASITITSKGFPERVVTVVQAGTPSVWGIPEESLIQHFTMDGDIRTIAVPTVREYTATSSQTWCAVTITDDGLEITVTPNDGEKRTSLVTLGAEGLSDIFLKVTQDGAIPFLEVPDDQLIQYFDENGGTRIITVACHQKYTAISSETWCYAEVCDNGLKISIPQNKSSERTARIMVSCNNMPDITIDVVQEGITPFISVKESGIWLRAGIQEFSLTVTANIPFVFELPAWIRKISCSPCETAIRKYTFIASSPVTVQENIIIKGVDGDVQAVVPVIQQEVMAIKAMTYNVRVYSSNDGDNNWPNRKDVAAQIIKNEGIDVAGLQEMSKNILGVDQFGDLKTLLSEDYDAYGYGRDESSISDEYNAIFYKKSRFRLIKSGVFWLSETPDVKSKGWDAAYYRIAVWTILEDKNDGQRLFFINTHLDNSGPTARLEGVKLIMTRINSLSEGLPVVLTGDFNAVPASEPVRYITNPSIPDHLLHTKDIAESRSGPNWTIHDYGVTPESQRIFLDYIFVNRSSEVTNHTVLPEKLNNIFLSDHCPVTSEILLMKNL